MRLTRADGTEFDFKPGDIIDLGADGFIVYYGGKEAEAQRMLLEERQRKTREVIEFVTQKVRKGLGEKVK